MATAPTTHLFTMLSPNTSTRKDYPGPNGWVHSQIDPRATAMSTKVEHSQPPNSSLFVLATILHLNNHNSSSRSSNNTIDHSPRNRVRVQSRNWAGNCRILQEVVDCWIYITNQDNSPYPDQVIMSSQWCKEPILGPVLTL